eukprot:TRINITY_DN112_c0_g1_i1.p1 TRINITY_DN112_c0_g1~~TRINITY_DN112_c0_g1_i1.p1  ORF type:complete len:353 (+),score=73.40 TRINITY_DN112_c0_g1_i1:31-1089(+)
MPVWVVIDNGSGSIKAGFSAEERPRVVIPSIVGYKAESSDFYVGAEAQSRRDLSKITFPIEHGIVTNWDAMQTIWEYTFDQLSVAPEKHPILVGEMPVDPKAYREKLTQIMFETFGTPGLFTAYQPLLSLYGLGKVTGLAIETGAGVTQIIPIYENYALLEAFSRVDLGGQELTHHLANLLRERGFSLDYQTVCDIKEKLCYISPDFQNEVNTFSTTNEKMFQLPDGNAIKIGTEMFRCPELLFQPSLISQTDGLHQAAFNSISKCDIEIRSAMWENVCLGGGNSLFPGIVPRLRQELAALAPPAIKVKIHTGAEREYSAWKGGSALAEVLDQWVHKQDYEESGPSIVHRCY